MWPFLNKTTTCTQVLTKSSYFFHQVCHVFIILYQLINFYYMYIIFIITDQLELDFIFLTKYNYYLWKHFNILKISFQKLGTLSL